MIDLDNTLVDRDAAFRGAAAAVLAEHGLPAGDLAWLTAVDASGYTPRREVARAMAQRYGSSCPETAVRAFLDHGAAERVTLAEDVRRALGEAVAAGWTCVVVTNGRAAQQETKIRRTGLDTLVHGWVVSETVGHEKPAPEIFRIAADTVGMSLDGAWMIGDSPHADVLGAAGVGARSVWVSEPVRDPTLRHIAEAQHQLRRGRGAGGTAGAHPVEAPRARPASTTLRSSADAGRCATACVDRLSSPSLPAASAAAPPLDALLPGPIVRGLQEAAVVDEQVHLVGRCGVVWRMRGWPAFSRPPRKRP